MWSDNETDIDLLGFDHLVSAIQAIIKNKSLLPATIGVYGDWGSGKSSLLKRTQAALEPERDILVLSFNGWQFEGYEDAKAALMGTIIDEIADKRTLVPKTKHLIAKLIKRINLLEALSFTFKSGLKAGGAYLIGGPTALGISATTDVAGLVKGVAEKIEESEAIDDLEVDKFIKENEGQKIRRGIREFRKDFGELLKETNITTLVVVIDDLDRCSPDTIIETLEAIKLFLFVPRTAFILGADERLVKYAVRRRFPELPGERVEVGRDYLEKLVQFDIRIPSLGRAELETYINLLFLAKSVAPESTEFKKAQEYVINANASSLLDVRFNFGIAKNLFDSIPKDLEEDLSLAQRISPVLAVGLNGNPRQCKRFLNKLMMRQEMARSKKIELKQRVLAKLMLLEYFRPEFFRGLAELQAEQQGHPKELAAAEQIVSPAVLTPTSNEVKEDAVEPEIAQSSTKNKGTGNSARKTSKSTSVSAPVSTENAPPPVSLWLSDRWMMDWLKSAPSLTLEDLQPYFFFSRDLLQGSMASALQRMTPQAQEMLNELFQESEAARNNALKKAKELNSGDAAAIFQALSERAREEEDAGAGTSAFNRLCDWVGVRSELLSQFIAFLNEFPDSELPISVVPKVEKIAKAAGEVACAVELIQRWSTHSTSPQLKAAATRRLRQLP